MFTGIVREVGLVSEFSKINNHYRLIVLSEIYKNYSLKGSIAVNGVCLTLVEVSGSGLCFEVVKESYKLTNLQYLKVNKSVNLESSLQLFSFLDGHLVMGHVDCMVKLMKIEENDYYFTLPLNFKKYIVLKGSVTLNGVSLTVSGVDESWFKVSLIPETLLSTTFQFSSLGDMINLEVDIVARYLFNLQ